MSDASLVTPLDRSILVAMGVSGTGKTTIGATLAGGLRWRYAEADDFHPPVNVAKMAAGHPLTDEDRWPWLSAIGRWIDERRADAEPAVVTCSALKRAYRELLCEGRPELSFVYLKGSRDVIAERLAARRGHFFLTGMLDSQLADLEEPAIDEQVITVPIGGTPQQIVDDLLARL